MPITVEYSPLPGLEKTGILAPMLPVTFVNDLYEYSTFALVDSGAESGLISTVIADELHIDWRSLLKQTGLATSGSFIFHKVPSLGLEVYGNKFNIAITVAEGINPFKCILGRNDIFRKAKITFEGYKNQFYLDFRKFN